jgi:hypothetical protein
MTETNDANPLYRAFLACLIMASLPVKNAAYVAPILYLLILFAHGEYRTFARVVVLCSAIAMISNVSVLWDHLSGRVVNVPGVWFGLITYAPLFVVLCESLSRTMDQRTYERIGRLCAWFILFQSVIGVCQFVASRNPDAVCGTFGLFDGFQNRITIAQVYFTFTIFGMILFLVPLGSQRLFQVAIAAGVLICVIAQSGHQTIFFVVTLIGCALTRVSHIGTLARAVVAAALMGLLVLQFYPNTIWLAGEWYRKVTDTSQSPKWLACEGAASILSEPKNMFIGTGLGQYSSRAALITSNEYLNVQLPGFMTGRSDYFNQHIQPSLELFNEIGEGSAMAKPYMSAISLPVELGVVLFTALLVAVCNRITWCARLMMGNIGQLGQIGFTMLVGILFFALCCFIENYAEFSQAVFVPFILFIVAGSRAQTQLRAAEYNLPETAAGASRLPKTSYPVGTRLLPR